MGLKKQWFHILLALAEGPTHGAEIRRRVRKNTGGSLELYPVMLYGSLDDLQESGLVRELDKEEERPPGGTERYRYHDLTVRGRETLATEAAEFQKVARIAQDLLSQGAER